MHNPTAASSPEQTRDLHGIGRRQNQFLPVENAFDALVDSVHIPAKQKLYLLNQHLDGKAKKVVEQLQYMVEQPEVAYTEARKILKKGLGTTR